ncbi:MAG: hypothetical protein ACHRHE_12765 [Tepidisphaerales bacterium]
MTALPPQPILYLEVTPMPPVKHTDSRGRLTLGRDFANQTVTVENVEDGQASIRVVRIIPDGEAWLYENPASLDAVRSGLADARVNRIGQGPNLKAAVRVAKKCDSPRK